MKRYDIYIGVEHGIDGGVPCIETDESPDGEWVRHEDVAASDETSSRLITALLAGNDALRDRLEAADRAAQEIRAEVAALTLTDDDKQRLWYENAIKMLAVAPNFVSATFDMDDRRVEILFYRAGGKTPGEVATELREKILRVIEDRDHARACLAAVTKQRDDLETENDRLRNRHVPDSSCLSCGGPLQVCATFGLCCPCMPHEGHTTP